jgi:hypothetical protein
VSKDLPARYELPATIVLTEMITNSPAAALVFPIGFATSRTGGRHYVPMGAVIDQ